MRLEGLARGYGGVQWFMRCPQTNRRVLTLWKPPGAFLFASRHAWRGQVAYRSQFEDVTSRAWSTKARIALRLGGKPGEYDFPGRPKGMRQTTFTRLADRYWAAEDVLDDQLGRAVSAIGYSSSSETPRSARRALASTRTSTSRRTPRPSSNGTPAS